MCLVCLFYKNKCTCLLLCIIFVLSVVLEIVMSIHTHLPLLQFIQQNNNLGLVLDINSKTTVAASVQLRELQEPV